MQPIWKDYFVNLPVDDTRNNTAVFRIEASSTTIYSGVAYPFKSTDTHVKVRINDICADYLDHGALIDDEATDTGNWSREFKVYCYDGGSEELIDTITFYNDWSYEYDFDPVRDGLSFPPLEQFFYGQIIPFSFIGGSTPNATFTMPDGTQVVVPLSGWEDLRDFNNDFNEDFATLYREGAVMFADTRGYPGAVSVEIEGHVWRLAPTCGRYVLYYVNAHGGWDSLPVAGNVKRQDDVKRYEAERVYNNGRPYNRGRRNYLNDLEQKYTLHPAPMRDAESERMHHLLNSTQVYLHDLQTGAIRAVVLTGKATERKTYRTNGGKLSEYTIEATLAQERIRR